jgi:hypothetical protein
MMARSADNSEPRWWKPQPLTWAMWAAVLWNAIMLWLALNGTFHHDAGNDAAGSAMSRAFEELFVMAAASLIGVLALLFLALRWQGVRVALLGLLGIISLLTPLLL